MDVILSLQAHKSHFQYDGTVVPWPSGALLNVAHVGLVGRGATVGVSGVPADTPGRGAPASGVPALLPGPRSVLLDRLEGVGVGPGPVLGDGPREPHAHWAASSNGLPWWACLP